MKLYSSYIGWNILFNLRGSLFLGSKKNILESGHLGFSIGKLGMAAFSRDR